MLEYALEYLADEWSCFPVCTPIVSKPGRCIQHGACRGPGKTPLVKWGQYQDELATAQQVEAWWTRWKDANIGMATGELSDVVVMDLDGEVAAAEAARRGYDYGPWSRTGKVGGQHRFFRYRPDAPTIFAKTGGIDFRGHGGYVLLPPSLHATGARYTWVEKYLRGEPLPDLPRWIDELAKTAVDGVSPRQKIDFGKLFDEGLPEGQRDQELFRAAAKLRGVDVPYALAVSVITELGARCQPPFSNDESRAKVDSAYSRYTPNAPEAPKDAPRIWRGDELAHARFDPVRWAIPGILPSGLTILAGRPKLGKSWLMLGWGLDVAGGHFVLRKLEVAQGPTLYLALEDSERRMQQRQALMLGDARPAHDFQVVTEWPRQDEGGLDLIEQWLDANPSARLIMIDTYKRFRPKLKNGSKNANLYDLDYDAVAPVHALANRRNVAIVLVMHTKKGEADDPIELISGTMGLSGAADGAIILKRTRGQADAELIVTGRDVEERELALKFEREDTVGWTLLGNADDFRQSRERKEIMDAIAAVPGMRASEIAAALGRPPGNVRRLLWSMTHDGQVRWRDERYFPPVESAGTGNTVTAVTAGTPITPERPTVTSYRITANTAVTPVTAVTAPVTDVSDACRRCGQAWERHSRRGTVAICPTGGAA